VLTIKIDPKLRAQVKALASELGLSTSELVRDALKQRVAQRTRSRAKSAFAATRDLCGVAETSDPGLSSRRMSVLMRARHGSPRTR
jgi:hypothetical protein